jgi:hypothetical protein
LTATPELISELLGKKTRNSVSTESKYIQTKIRAPLSSAAISLASVVLASGSAAAQLFISNTDMFRKSVGRFPIRTCSRHLF